MLTAIQEKVIPEDEFIQLLAHNEWIEVVEGEVVLMNAAYFDHSYIIENVRDLLKPFVREHKLGYVFGDGVHFKLDATAKGLRGTRIPDACFIRKTRLARGFNLKSLFPGAPDLAVEVVSPTEGEEITLAKMRDYLRFGSDKVWVLYPMLGEVHVYKQSSPKNIQIYSDDDILTSESLFPGLEIKVSQFFEMPVLD